MRLSIYYKNFRILFFVSIAIFFYCSNIYSQRIGITQNNMFATKNIWHGDVQIDSSFIYQPDLTISYKNSFWLNVCGLFSIENHNKNKYDQFSLSVGTNTNNLFLNSINLSPFLLDLEIRYISYYNYNKTTYELIFDIAHYFSADFYYKIGFWSDLKLDKQNMVFVEIPFYFTIESLPIFLSARGEYTKKNSNPFRAATSNVELELATSFQPEITKYISVQPAVRINSLGNIWFLLNISFI